MSKPAQAQLNSWEQDNWTFAANACDGKLSAIRKVAAALNERDAKIEQMLAALKQATSRADADLKKKFRGRTDQCAKDYAMCMAAIAKAEGRT